MKQKKLENLVDAINGCIKELSRAKFSETAELLRMARIDLIARANGISDEEMELFAFALQKNAARK